MPLKQQSRLDVQNNLLLYSLINSPSDGVMHEFCVRGEDGEEFYGGASSGEGPEGWVSHRGGRPVYAAVAGSHPKKDADYLKFTNPKLVSSLFDDTLHDLEMYNRPGVVGFSY
jgi:hypothetical protein